MEHCEFYNECSLLERQPDEPYQEIDFTDNLKGLFHCNHIFYLHSLKRTTIAVIAPIIAVIR